jgi:Cys-tRNA(Pro)/Cys-tRNA(Cys) deacylase
MAEPFSPAAARLEERSIPHRVFQHTGPVSSLEQAAQERGEKPEQVIRSLLFHLSEQEYVMVLMPGPGQVPWKALRRFLKQSRVTMANEEELLAVAGCQPGSVNPISINQPVRILIERTILLLDEISIGSCIRGTAIILKPDDLLKALENYEIVDFLN